MPDKIINRETNFIRNIFQDLKKSKKLDTLIKNNVKAIKKMRVKKFYYDN